MLCFVSHLSSQVTASGGKNKTPEHLLRKRESIRIFWKVANYRYHTSL